MHRGDGLVHTAYIGFAFLVHSVHAPASASDVCRRSLSVSPPLLRFPGQTSFVEKPQQEKQEQRVADQDWHDVLAVSLQLLPPAQKAAVRGDVVACSVSRPRRRLHVPPRRPRLGPGLRQQRGGPAGRLSRLAGRSRRRGAPAPRAHALLLLLLRTPPTRNPPRKKSGTTNTCLKAPTARWNP